jgi:hypothetical protein
VAVPVVIFVLCLAAGVYAAARWLPDLAPGPVGGLAFFAVCGLLGAALSVFGLRIYTLVEDLSQRIGLASRVTFADEVGTLLWESGLLVALAFTVYLLAPRARAGDEAVAPLVSDAEPGSRSR